MGNRQFMFVWSWMLMSVILLIVGVHLIQSQQSDRLIGFGCVGYDQPIVANEEDDFPMCQGIVRIEDLNNLPRI